jgi:hypothetical protein
MNNPEHEAAFIEECAKRGIVVESIGHIDIGTEDSAPMIIGGYFRVTSGDARWADSIWRAVRVRFGLPAEWQLTDWQREMARIVSPFGDGE